MNTDARDGTAGPATNAAEYDATRHWGLPLYNDATPLDMRDGFNRAMRRIDQILTQLDTKIQEKG